MLRRLLVIALLATEAMFIHAQPSLPSSFQAKTIHSPEAADIFARWGGKGPLVGLIPPDETGSDKFLHISVPRSTDNPPGIAYSLDRIFQISCQASIGGFQWAASLFLECAGFAVKLWSWRIARLTNMG
jgi:hypothetical protein